jgi:hypothetical protein
MSLQLAGVVQTLSPSGSAHSRTPFHHLMPRHPCISSPPLHLSFKITYSYLKPPDHIFSRYWRLPGHLEHANPSPEGTLNAAYNCLDRHYYANPDKTAIIYEADESSESREISFRELMKETCKIANVLKSWGVKKGDAVSI